jgi:hypothetical protein
MKSKLLFLFVLILIGNLFAQRWEMRENQRKRIEELKKVKLIEALDLSEDESTKFFALYNEHQKKVRAIQKERDDVLDQLEKLTKSEAKFQSKKFEELQKRLFELEQELFRNRQEFIISLNNVLSPYKIAKFLVFEREFMRELNRLIMRGRNRMNPVE